MKEFLKKKIKLNRIKALISPDNLVLIKIIKQWICSRRCIASSL